MNQITSQRKRPVFGSFSIAFPMLGAALGVAMAHTAHGNGEGWAEIAEVSHYFGVSLALGFVSALISFIRFERFLLLPTIGIIINAVPVVVIRLL